MKKSHFVAAATVAMVIGTTVAVTAAANPSTSSASSTGASHRAKPVRIEVFAPARGANAGANGFGWFVDIEVEFLGKNLHPDFLAKILGYFGLSVGAAGVVGIPLALIPLSPSSLVILVFAQTIWSVGAGVLLLRNR